MTQRSPSKPPKAEGEDRQVPAFAPVPRKCKRHDGWTPERQRAFIDTLCDTGSVKAAARAVNMASEGAYNLRRQLGAEEFAAAWDAALDHGMQILRDAAMDRAIHGVEVPVYSYGKLVGARTVYNDRLAAFMLRNYDGRMSGGASGLPQRLKRIVDEEVARQRAEWEAKKEAAGEASSRRFGERMDHIKKVLGERGLWPEGFGISRWETYLRICAIWREVSARIAAEEAGEIDDDDDDGDDDDGDDDDGDDDDGDDDVGDGYADLRGADPEP